MMVCIEDAWDRRGAGIYVGPWKHLSFEDGRLDFSRSHWDGYTSKWKAIYH